MKILILATMAPLFGFYLYALVNFQRELRHSKRNEIPGAKTIPLYWNGGQLSAASPAIGSRGQETQMGGLPVWGQRRGVPPVEDDPWQEIYQVESVYLGPFLVVPIRRRKEQGAQRRVTEITARRAG
jgi:hypothetical protein